MIVVVAFCSKDCDLQRRNLEWALELDSGCGREGVLSYDSATPKDAVAAITELAMRYFTKVHHCHYSEPPVKGWPAACNWAWQSTARWMFAAALKQPWLWLEADAMPLKSGWVLALEQAFNAGGKSFGGHIVKDMHHMNGVGIYPWDVLRRNEMAMLARAAAWDVVLKPSIVDDCVNLNHLIQHAWNVHPIDRNMIWNGEGTPLSFKDASDIDRYMDFNAVLLHRVKDGSLIPLLREKHRAEQEKQRLILSTDYNVPQHTAPHEVDVLKALELAVLPPQTHEQNRQENRSDSSDQRAAMDDHVPGGVTQGNAVVADSGEVDQGIVRYTGNCEIFIVTYGKPTKRPSGLVVSDFDWLAWCLRAIRRFCRGFSGVTIAIPGRDSALLQPITKEHAQAKCGIPLRVKLFTEPDGKGFLMHEAIIAQADKHCPKGITNHVLHLDADCIFRAPVTPDEYIVDGKPVYVWRTYDSLAEVREGQKVVSDCAQWRGPTEQQLGFETNCYSMCRHPSCFPVDFYDEYRTWVAKVHGMDFEQYMLSGRNEHPADRMDFTAMGAFAHKKMHDQFHWIDISQGNHLAPRDKQKAYWSHHGVSDAVKTEIEGFLK